MLSQVRTDGDRTIFKYGPRLRQIVDYGEVGKMYDIQDESMPYLQTNVWGDGESMSEACLMFWKRSSAYNAKMRRKYEKVV